MLKEQINEFIHGGGYLDIIPSLSGEQYFWLAFAIVGISLLSFAIIMIHFQALRKRVGMKGTRTLWVSVMVSLVSVVLVGTTLMPFPKVFEREYVGTPDASCQVYITGKKGEPVLDPVVTDVRFEMDPATQQPVLVNGQPVIVAGSQKTEHIPRKWDYYIPLQDLKPTPTNHLQVKLMQDTLYGQVYHLCSFDLTIPENRQMSQRLQERMEEMQTMNAMKMMKQMQKNPEKMQEMAKKLAEQGKAGKSKLDGAKAMLEKLEKMRQAEAEKQAKEGKGKGKGKPAKSGDGMRIQLPTTNSEMEWLEEHNVETDKPKENSTKGSNRTWEETSGDNPFEVAPPEGSEK